MQYMQQCRFMIYQNLRVSHFIEIFLLVVATNEVFVTMQILPSHASNHDLPEFKSIPFYRIIQGKHEDHGHTVHVYGLTRVLVFLLVDETMQYRQQCRFTINQNLRVYHIIKIFEEKPCALCAYVRSDQGSSVFACGRNYAI